MYIIFSVSLAIFLPRVAAERISKIIRITITTVDKIAISVMKENTEIRPRVCSCFNY